MGVAWAFWALFGPKRFPLISQLMFSTLFLQGIAGHIEDEGLDANFKDEIYKWYRNLPTAMYRGR